MRIHLMTTNIQRQDRNENFKKKSFNKQNNNFARASRFYFLHFFAIFARLRHEDA